MRIAFWIVLAAIALTMLYAWIGLISAPAAPLRLWPGAATLSVPQWMVPIGGLLLAGVALAGLAERDYLPTELSAPVFAPLVLAATILVWLSVDRGVVEPLRGGLLLMLALLTVASALTTLAMLRSGGPIGVRSYWGGLGNGMGGWQVLPTTVAFLLTLTFLGATLLVAIDRGGPAAAKVAAAPPASAAAAQARPPSR